VIVPLDNKALAVVLLTNDDDCKINIITFQFIQNLLKFDCEGGYKL
jgi:hypothetical protein